MDTGRHSAINKLNSTLLQIHRALLETKLVTDRVASDENIEEFSTELNTVLVLIPEGDEFNDSVGEYVRFLYKQNGMSLRKYFELNRMDHWMLMTDGKLLGYVYNINDLVSIRYQYIQRDFQVSRWEARPQLRPQYANNPAQPSRPYPSHLPPQKPRGYLDSKPARARGGLPPMPRDGIRMMMRDMSFPPLPESKSALEQVNEVNWADESDEKK